MSALKGGVAYFLLVFGFAFLLGAGREMLMPLGLPRALLVWIEIPIVLAFAWWAAGWAAARFAVPIGGGARIVMGVVMVALVQAGEFATARWLMGQTAGAVLARYATAAGALELLPQALTALFPLLRARLTGR